MGIQGGIVGLALWGMAAGAAYADDEARIDLGEVFSQSAKWAVDDAGFFDAYGEAGFRFVDGRQFAVSSRRDRICFLKFEVFEARVYFSDEALSRVEVSVYNKGDAGVKDREAFEALTGSVKAALEALTGDSGVTGKTSNDRANYVVRRQHWVKYVPNIQLEWAYVEPHRSGGKHIPFGAEYITVRLVPQESGGGLPVTAGGQSDFRAKNARTIKENVARSPQGDVRIERVPMVDQGRKGYCAAATSERVLRYYGVEIDQNQIAQLAETAAQGGTTLDGMVKAVAKVGRQFQLDKKELVFSESVGRFDQSEHAELLDAYNSAAERMQANPINWQRYTDDNVLDIQAVCRAMDPAVLLAARCSQRQAMDRFVRNVIRYVDQGVPLLWSCMVGYYREEPPLEQQGVSGHIRLIVGYNMKTRELLYSDSWGPLHACKRLPIDQAWAMTKGVILLKPRGVR